MRKLTDIEVGAVMFLEREGPFVPGDMLNATTGQTIKSVLDSLVKKKRATVEMTDDGPRYTAISNG
jgi:hypothetical protein